MPLRHFLPIIFLLPVFSFAGPRNEPIKPITPIVFDAKKAALGNLIFHDKRLSKDNTISCASCHDIRSGGDDGRVVSLGVGKKPGDVNSPTILNSALNFRQFWDGRALNLLDQMNEPVANPKEMGTTWEEVVAKLGADESYQKQFRALGLELNLENIKRAIEEFEKSMVTPGAPFDRYLAGDDAAITPAQIKGYQIFKERGCIACHQGVNVGGNMFQTMGIMGNYFVDRGNIKEADLGRFVRTKKPEDRHVFKVPSLRNVALTAPYFHDGSAHDLPQAIKTMARYQLGQELGADDVKYIVQFLESLTGIVPGSGGK